MKIIHWKSLITQATGHGIKALPDYVAEETVKSLNKEYTEIHHWTEEV